MADHASATTARKQKFPEGEDAEETAAGLCVNDCGFYGAAATGNMCSKCYREHVALAAASDNNTAAASVSIAPAASVASPEEKAKTGVCIAPAASIASPEEKAKTGVSIAPAASIAFPEEKAKTGVVSVASSDRAVDTSAKQQQQEEASTAKRCATCRKKVGLLGFRCRCEATFCSVHRYSDKHDCGFDYKAAGREQIAKRNPIVVADKIARI